MKKSEILKEEIKSKTNFVLYQNEIFINVEIKNNTYKIFKYHIDECMEDKKNSILGEKIVYNTSKKYMAFAYTTLDCTPSIEINIIKSQRINLKYLLAILNSKLISFYLNNRRVISPRVIMSLPLQQIEDFEPFEILVDYIIFLKKLNINIDKYATNENIIKYHFEELIDALVYELYFKKEFIEKNIELFKYAKEYLKPIKFLNENEKKETIHEAYMFLDEQRNKLKNNLELMNIRLRDLILPIKREL